MPRLLIVDDEEPILFAMREYFEHRGWTVDTAPDLATAEGHLDRNRFAAVVADLRLSPARRSEGLDLVAGVRAKWPSTRVLLLTAYGSSEIETEARRLGVDAFLHKPKPLAEIAEILRRLTETQPSGPPAAS